MNEMQKKILIAVALIIFAMLIYVPFEIQTYAGNVFRTGYGFIFDLPTSAQVSVGTLFAQWFGVIAIGGILFLLAKKN